jgi:hypothetical protein
MRSFWALIIVFVLMPSMAKAESVACPGKIDHVLVEAGKPVAIGGSPGHEILSHGYIEQNVGGDYDENEPQLEWDDLELASQPVIAHCFPAKDNENGKDIVIPASINKCVYIKKTQHFFCE